MANSIDISYSNGIYTVRAGTSVVGRGRTLETALENAAGGEPPPDWLFGAAQILEGIMGPPRESHGQIATHAPGD